MKTDGVKKLVTLALEGLPKPYDKDVIDHVFFAIESNDKYRLEYEGLCTDLGKATVNTWSGFWIANALGKVGLQQVVAQKSKLIQSYSILGTDTSPSGANRKEDVASLLMYEFFKAHKDTLPKSIATHRELIIELLMEGLPVERVFEMVQMNVE